MTRDPSGHVKRKANNKFVPPPTTIIRLTVVDHLRRRFGVDDDSATMRLFGRHVASDRTICLFIFIVDFPRSFYIMIILFSSRFAHKI